MNDFDAMMNYIEGLQQGIKKEVLYRSPKSLNEAIRTAAEFDATFSKSLNTKCYFLHINSSHFATPRALLQDYSQAGSKPQSVDTSPEPMELCNIQDHYSPYYNTRNYRYSYSGYRGGYRGSRSRGRALPLGVGVYVAEVEHSTGPGQD